jgi:hypothetical protein
MTHISFTSGEILDIISALEDKAEIAEEKGQFQLANYYFNMIQQFEKISEKMDQLPGENRVANLVLAMN